MKNKNPEELLAALDPQQQEVALQVGGPLCVRAGAGTGKTRAITYRIAYGVAVNAFDPSAVLAVTFTARAAAEMRSRLRELGVSKVQARTFHSAALRQLTFFWNRAFSGSRPEIIAYKASLVAAAATRVGIKLDKALVRDLAAAIEWSKVSMIDIGDYAATAQKLGRENPGDITDEDFVRIYDAYEQAKTERQVIDFEDVLALLCGVLTENDDVAAQVRRQYRSFVVDEYQDVSALQQHLLDLWRGDRRDICVVGDVAQTIYSFAGATSRYLVDFHKQFPEGRTVELHRDYRSTPQIVAVANQVLARAKGTDGLGKERGLVGAVRLVSQRDGGPAVTFVNYLTDDEQAEEIAQKILQLKASGTSLAKIAILYRTNSQSESFEKALTDRGIGVQLHGGTRFFEREEIRRAVVTLRQTARMRKLVGTEGQPAVPTLLQDVRIVAATFGWSAEAPATQGAVRDRWDNLDALVSLAKSRSKMTLEQFVTELQERSEAQAAPEVNGVVLSTLHASKGLEWDAVFIAGASEGLMPISLVELPEGIEEERRLLYVGITRARDFLQISYARSRSSGRAQQRKVSRFLAPIWPETSPETMDRSDRVALALTARQKLVAEKSYFGTTADDATKELFGELRAWRLGVAKKRAQPAFTIMADVTLQDVATAKPKTLRQLGALRGIGEIRMAEYGADILRIIREFSNDA